MRSALLALTLGNDSNDCYLNSVLLAELWACCMDNTFDWLATGMWMQPLQHLLTQGATMQLLTATACLGRLLTPWFVFHAAGHQHDAARLASTCIAKWEARFKATTEDSGLACAPV